MADSIRYTVATTLKTGLETILTNNGYRTNVGQHVNFGYIAPTNIPRDQLPSVRINFPAEKITHYTACEKQRDIDVEIMIVTHGGKNFTLLYDSDQVLEDIVQYIITDEMLNGLVDTISDLEIENHMIDPYNVSIIAFKYNYTSQYKAASEVINAELGVDNVLVEF